jgi:hypothetical protein
MKKKLENTDPDNSKFENITQQIPLEQRKQLALLDYVIVSLNKMKTLNNPDISDCFELVIGIIKDKVQTDRIDWKEIGVDKYKELDV